MVVAVFDVTVVFFATALGEDALGAMNLTVLYAGWAEMRARPGGLRGCGTACSSGELRSGLGAHREGSTRV